MTVTKTFTGTGWQTYTIPASITSIMIDAWGAQGGGSKGGEGGHAGGNVSVTPGQKIYLICGQRPGGRSGGVYGGGNGGSGVNAGTGYGGGGITIVRNGSTSGTVYVIAGGGGGQSGDGGAGGNGGPTGQSGGRGPAGTVSNSFVHVPTGGTNAGKGGAAGEYVGGSGGGKGGAGSNWSGVRGDGGNGGKYAYNGPGGGGGGSGWGGGGGGGAGSSGVAPATGGAGGSNYVNGGMTGTWNTANGGTGHGRVVITHADPNSAPYRPVITSPANNERTSWGVIGTVQVRSSDPDGDNVRSQVQLSNYGGTFGELGTFTSGYASSGSTVSIPINNMQPNKRYTLRCRAQDSNGVWSPWSQDVGAGRIYFYTARPPSTPTGFTVTKGTKNSSNTIIEVKANGKSPDHVRVKAVFRYRSGDGNAYTDYSTGYASSPAAFTYSRPVPNNTHWRYYVRIEDEYGQSSAWVGPVYAWTNRTPTAPTSLSPSGSTNVDPGAARTFSWKHNDPDGDSQSKFDLQWRVKGQGWNSRSANQSGQSTSIPSGTFPSGVYIEWRVRTSDGYLTSPWSSIATFQTTGQDAPTLTAPANGSPHKEGDGVAISWKFNDPNPGDSQSKADLQYRKYGTSSWTSWNGFVTTATSATIPTSRLQPAGNRMEWRVRTYDSGGVAGPWSGVRNFYIVGSPNAPSLSSPLNGKNTNVDTVNRFSWKFSDPDTVSGAYGDAQSKFELRYRKSGATSWEPSITSVTTQQYVDIPASTFSVSDYEWQVRTWDSLGYVGPWSSSGFFSGVTPPEGLSITEPVDGSTVIGATTVEWSVPDQDVYQVRKVADNPSNQSPDTSTVYWDTGEVSSSTTRSVEVPFPTNNRSEHVQVRVKSQGFWSDWADIRVTVDYVAPPTATVTAVAQDGDASIRVTAINPDPGAEEPPITTNILYVVNGKGETAVATTDMPPNGSFIYHFPASGEEYTFYVEAVGDNGTSTISDSSEPVSVKLTGTWILDPLSPAETKAQFIYNDHGADESMGVQAEFVQYSGRVLPVVEFGTQTSRNITTTLTVFDKDGGKDTLLGLVLRRSILLYRDYKGRKMYCAIDTQTISDRADFSVVGLNVTEVDHGNLDEYVGAL